MNLTAEGKNMETFPTGMTVGMEPREGDHVTCSSRAKQTILLGGFRPLRTLLTLRQQLCRGEGHLLARTLAVTKGTVSFH